MKTITRKSDINVLLEKCFTAYQIDHLAGCISTLQVHILSQKVKFPLLEFCAAQLYERIPQREHISLCDGVHALKTEGGNVILGILLQKRLTEHFSESMEKATEYISKADIWYVCDIIGERVYGYSLLHDPKKTIPVLKKLSKHPINWVIRSLGAGSHYAIKKGLDKKNVSTVFKLLLTMANTKDKEIRQGVGWAAKTTAKFHPTIIDDFKVDVENTEHVANWFRKKIEIGLQRNTYLKS
ncbi:DNA alkylation repair protein [Kordia sp.]|uniref:DNA alkylation repair protein n=1 Tax=Kordia sp. TaxID=1965332 RepID=UPI003D2BC190